MNEEALTFDGLDLKEWQGRTFNAAQELCIAIEQDPTMPSLICGHRQLLAPRTIRALRDLAVCCGFSDSRWVNMDIEGMETSAKFPSETIVRAREWEAWHAYQHNGPPQAPHWVYEAHPCNKKCGSIIIGARKVCMACEERDRVTSEL